MRKLAILSVLWGDNSGATAIEYAFVAVLISTVAIAAINSIGAWTAASFAAVANSL